MKTSYFKATINGVRVADLPNAVSIALRPPKWFKGRTYPALAPTWKMLTELKRSKEPTRYFTYQNRFNEDILSKLDPKKVLKDLGEDAILLCWEEPPEYCHRYDVAQWLFYNTGVSVRELRED